MLNLLAVGAGGFIGACARYGISRVLSQFPLLPFGTLLSNVIAAILIGFIVGTERQACLLPERIQLFLIVGLLGGLSTFSAFSMETIEMIERKKYFLAIGNVLPNVCFCLIFVVAGLQLAKLLIKT
jgi:CrcB protein